MSEPVPQPSFRQRAVDVAHPLRRPGGYALPHLLLIAVILVIVAFLAGWFVSSRYNASYFQKHYGADVRATTRQSLRINLPVTTVRPAIRVATTARVSQHYYPGVGDQDGVGACAQFVATWGASFLARLQHMFPGFPKFSPWYTYNVINKGADNGSNVEDVSAIFASTGVPRYSQYSHPNLTYPLPTLDDHGRNLLADAAKYRMMVTFTNGGVGQNAIDFCVQTLAAGRPCQFAFPVYENFFGTKGDVPMPAGNFAGGHEMAFVGYDFQHHYSDGTTGLAFLGQNQWTKQFGINGFAWFSAAFVQKYTWEMTSMSASPIAAKTAAPKVIRSSPRPVRIGTHPASGQGPVFSPPTAPSAPKAGRGGGYWLRKSAPYASLVNAAGKFYHVWPQGIEALIYTESNANPYAVRCVSYYDCSAGLTQVSVPTARQYGVQGTTDQVLNWEKVPSNAIWLAARVLRDFRAICGWQFTRLYECFNEGAYRGHDAYVYPTPGYGVQAYTAYLGWIRYVSLKYK
jgi:hypothetical protein